MLDTYAYYTVIKYATGKGPSNGGAPLCVRCCWCEHPTQLMKTDIFLLQDMHAMAP